MEDKKIASSIKGTILNVNRRFDKLKTSLPHKHRKLKQLVRLVQTFACGLEDELAWTEETCRLLDENLEFETFSEVRTLHSRYEIQMVDSKLHAGKIKAKNNSYAQIESIVGNEKSENLNRKLRILNERWQHVQERGESQQIRVRQVFVTWNKFQETLARLQSISKSLNVVSEYSLRKTKRTLIKLLTYS